MAILRISFPGTSSNWRPCCGVVVTESKQELARKVQKRRLRWPDHVFDDVLGVSPSEVPEPGAQGFCGPREEDCHAAGDDVVDSLQYTAPHAVTPVPPPVAPAVAAATPPPPPPAELLVDAQQTPPPPALMPVMPQGAQHCSEAETTQKDLRNGVKISQEKYLFFMAQSKDALFVRDTAKAIWGIQNLYNRSITGTPCRRFLHKEDGGPPSVEKQA
ncbi:uncharacterized protein LOC142774328 [Rhipicephalus microplus]|uniref:uncharacterized protein LOC142774328 n=1 Tax=Rhipicephalus microplus TaxID=6941 RepID=UPI003F6B14A4